MSRFLFAGCIGDTRPSARYLIRKEKESKTKLLSPKQSVKFKCHKWSKIIKKFTKKCLDASSRAQPPQHHYN